MLQKIINVSFPRSGHQVLVNTLLKYFSANPDFKEISRILEHETAVIKAGELCYCEYYNHCNVVGCTVPLTNLQKNHDLYLKLSMDEFNFLVQYRSLAESMVSWYELGIKQGSLKEDTYEVWRDHLNGSKSLWISWMIKWLEYAHSDRFLCISYGEFTKSPSEVLEKVLKFIEPNHVVDKSLLDSVVSMQNISKTRVIKDFKYYEEDIFKDLREWDERITRILKIS